MIYPVCDDLNDFFLASGSGRMPEEAFMRLRQEALALGGNQGITEKAGFQRLVPGESPYEEILRNNRPNSPACCVEVKGNQECRWFPPTLSSQLQEELADARTRSERLFVFFGQTRPPR